MKFLTHLIFGLVAFCCNLQVLAQSTSLTPKTTLNLGRIDSSGSMESPLFCSGDVVYMPMPAFDANDYSGIAKDGKLVRLNWPATADEKNKLLPNISTQVAYEKVNGSVDVVGLFSANTRREKVTIDFMKYRSEPIMASGSDDVLAYGRIGVGMRLKIDVTSSEGAFGGNLLAIAASAKAGKANGTISVDIIGLDANDITLSVPFTTDLSEGSIQKIIESLAVVKTKFRAKETEMTPQFIASIRCIPGGKVAAL